MLPVCFFIPLQRGNPVLTEAEVLRSYRKLLVNVDLTPEVFEKVEVLLDELRPESPLRHRLVGELDELRELTESKA